MNAKIRRRAAGFTLPELLITMAIASILASMAVPGFQGYIGNQQARSASQQLFSTLRYARSEAIKRNASVTVAAVDGAWDNGWSVSAAGSTSRRTAALDGLALDDGAGSDPVGSFSFDRRGRLQGGGLPRIGFCTDAGSASVARREVSVDLSGRANIVLSGNCP